MCGNTGKRVLSAPWEAKSAADPPQGESSAAPELSQAQRRIEELDRLLPAAPKEDNDSGKSLMNGSSCKVVRRLSEAEQKDLQEKVAILQRKLIRGRSEQAGEPWTAFSTSPRSTLR